MKIVIPNIDIPIIRYIAQCLESIKHKDLELLFWNLHNKSIIDVFDEVGPHIILVHESQLDQSFQSICEGFNFKYIVICDTEPKFNLSKLPEAVISLSPIKQNTTKYNILYNMSVAKIPEIYNAKFVKHFESEILLDTSSISFNNDLKGLVAYLVSNYSTKIIGNNPVPFKQYLGKVTIEQRANFIKSTKLLIDVGNAGDYLDAAYLKIAALCSYSTNNTTLRFNDLTTLDAHVSTILTKDLVRQRYISQSYEYVSTKTSYHFSAVLFDLIQEHSIAETLLDYIRDRV